MADGELPPIRSPEQVTVTVRRARNLRGLRGDSLVSQIKVEFGDKVLGETPKVECMPDSPAEYNHNSTLTVTFEDPAFLDELGYKPILLTIIEVLPKEKKAKEEKTLNLGQCTVDLMPLLRGEVNPKYTLQVHGLPSSPMENIPAEVPKPEVDVELKVNEAILSESQLSECNLMTITTESLFSPPDSWQMPGSQYIYTASLPLPITSEKENVVVFPSGQLKPGIEKEVPNKQKKWFIPGSAQGNAIYIPDSYVSSDTYEEEAGDFRSKDDREHRIVAEQDKNRVTWNTERRSYLDSSATKSFQDKIAKTRYWPMEVMRVPLPSGNKTKKFPSMAKHSDDDGSFSYHGVVYINMAPLLYPGVKRIRGAYRVYAYDEREVFEKTKRKGALADEVVKIASGMLFRNTQSPFAKKGADKAVDKKEPKKGKAKDIKEDEASAMLKPSDTNSQVEDAPVNVEGLQYVEAKSYVMLEICLNRPLIPKRPAEEVARRVAEYIPPRPLFPKRTNGAQKAVEDFHQQVGKVANQILDEFRELFGTELLNAGGSDLPNTDADLEARRQKMIYELNSSGKYFAFKEQLKHSVVKIVREKYLKTTTFTSKDDLQAFLSELYVYLVDQMHIGLGNVLTLEDKTPVPEPLTDSAQLKHFAREAEVNENFELATKYYQERIARNKTDSSCWFDYGTFCLYINDIAKAEECFKECVAINQKHVEGLMLYGVVCAMEEKNEAAETFFEAATCVDPKNVLAWTMLGLFYHGISNEISAEMAMMEADKLNISSARKAMKPVKGIVAKNIEPPPTPEHMTVDEAKESEVGEVNNIDTKSIPSINKIPATPSMPQEKGTSQTKAKPTDRKQSIAQGKKAGSMGSRTSSKENVSSARPGSRHVRSPGTPQVPENHEIEEPRESTPVPPQSVYMMASDWLLEAKAMAFTERALAHELLSTTGGPSPQYYISLARLCLQKKDFEKAEEALEAAVQADHQNPDAWGIMGHLRYLSGDLAAAKDCYERTISFLTNPSETHSIYLRLASIYLQDGMFQEAKRTFLLACKKSPSCVSWLGVGIACYRLSELSEAEDALSEANILNNSDPEVWAFLSMVCLKTARQLEAEQAYKYALKVGLTDEDLLAEILSLQEEVGFGNPQL